MLSDFLSPIYEAFDSLPTLLKILVFVFAVIPIMVSIQLLIMPMSILICMLDAIMNLACANSSHLEPDFLQCLAFFPIVLIWLFGENTLKSIT